jgi:hypothetical protein
VEREGVKMDPITRMMKRYINMPLKKALPLLFIGALLLSCTTGCIDFAGRAPAPDQSDTDTTIKTTYGSYKNHQIVLDTYTDPDGTRREVVKAGGGYCSKTFDKNGLLKHWYIQYLDGANDSKTFTTPIEDPIPGLAPGKELIDNKLATQTKSEPLTPFTSGIGDNTQATDTTTEQSTTDSGTGGWPGYPIQNGPIRSGDTGEIIQGGV